MHKIPAPLGLALYSLPNTHSNLPPASAQPNQKGEGPTGYVSLPMSCLVIPVPQQPKENKSLKSADMLRAWSRKRAWSLVGTAHFTEEEIGAQEG